MFRLLAVAVALLVTARLVFDGLNFVPAAVCIHHSRTIETCEDKNLLPQNISNLLNTIGAYLEALSSVLFLSMLFLWQKFHIMKFLIAILKVGHFWLWFVLCSSEIVTILQVDLTKAQSNGKPDDLGFGLIMEAIALTIFTSALNFVSRETIRHYFKQQYSDTWSHIFLVIYFGVLVSYFVRNFGLFLYDTALLTMSISSSHSSSSHNKGWDSVLLVLSCAFRGCLFRFFFSKIFQGCKPPTVCENVEARVGESLLASVQQ